MAIVISFLGVGMVAIPTGIISAGFVESYTRLKHDISDKEELPLRVMSCILKEDHPWMNRRVEEIILPPQTVIVSLVREGNEVPVKADTLLLEGDTIILGDESFIGIL